MKKLVAAVALASGIAATAQPAAAGSSTDAALALGAFAVFNQIVRGETIFHSSPSSTHVVRETVVVHQPPVVVSPAPVVVHAPPAVVYGAPAVVYPAAPMVVYRPAPVIVQRHVHPHHVAVRHGHHGWVPPGHARHHWKHR